MAEGFRIGAWSMVLLVLAAELLVLAAMLWRGRGADRWLAVALASIAGMLTPFWLGYAGAYDAWPWLSFAPFSVPLLLGPALYAYATRLADGRGIGRTHWIAPALQFGEQAVLFPLPVATKERFVVAWQEPLVGPLVSLAVLFSLGFYAVQSARVLRRYEGWLRARRRDPAPARRLRAPVIVLAVLVAARAGYDLWDRAIAPITYFDLFAYYIAIGVLGLWIGLDGWRGGHRPMPVIEEPRMRDWAATGRDWIDRLATEGWWRDEALDVDGFARRLGTNATHASRALNAAEGSFSAIVGRLRAEAVAARIAGGDGDDLLALALDCGFGSKASFNRAFRARFGCTPSAYRADVSERGSSRPDDETRRAPA